MALWKVDILHKLSCLQIRSDGLEEWNIEFCVFARGIGLRSGGQSARKFKESDICETFSLYCLLRNSAEKSDMFCIKCYNYEGGYLYEDVTGGVCRRGRVECMLILGGK